MVVLVFAGTVSMATLTKDGGSSQFFIAKQPTLNFDEKMTVFGRVIDGMPIVNKIQNGDFARPGREQGEPSRIRTATVLRKRDHEYVPVKLNTDTPNNSGDALDK